MMLRMLVDGRSGYNEAPTDGRNVPNEFCYCERGAAVARLTVRDMHQFILFETVRSSAWSRLCFPMGRALGLVGLLAWMGLRNRRGAPALFGHATAIGCAGMLFDLMGLGLQLLTSGLEAHVAGGMMLGIGQSCLISAWALYLVRLRQRGFFIAFIAFFAAAGIVEMLLSLMDRAALGWLTMSMPIISFALLAALGHVKERALLVDRADEVPQKGGERMLSRPKLLAVLFTFFGYSFIARELTDIWMGGLSDEPLMLFQLFGSLGTALSAAVVYMAFCLRRSYKNPAMYTVFVVFVVVVALYLSMFLTGYLSVIYLVPLFVLRKMLLFLPMAFARDFGHGARAERMFCAAMLFAELGSVVQTGFFLGIAGLGLSEDVFGSLAMVAIVIYVVVVEWSSFFKMKTVDVLAISADVAGGDEDAMARAVARLGEESGLSARELEVLGYLAVGHNAEYVAKALGVAVSTAKSHIAHIYRKTGHNSQQRLMDTIEAYAAGDTAGK